MTESVKRTVCSFRGDILFKDECVNVLFYCARSSECFIFTLEGFEEEHHQSRCILLTANWQKKTPHRSDGLHKEGGIKNQEVLEVGTLLPELAS